MIIDKDKGKQLADLLYRTFLTDGIHGETVMPEDLLPAGVKTGSREHLIFTTLTVAIDYQRDAVALWNSSRRSFEDPATQYLFEPEKVVKAPPEQVRRDMRKYKLSKKSDKDASIWTTIANTLFSKYESDPRRFLDAFGWEGDRILEGLRSDKHLNNGTVIHDFPYLRGEKIGPLWVRMLRDNLGFDIKNMELIPIPVDVHVARSTLALGVVRGQYEGDVYSLFEYIRMAWFESVKGLTRPDGHPMIALDVDEPLWHLSRSGCTYRESDGSCPKKAYCPCPDYCIPGAINLDAASSKAEVNTSFR